MELTMRIPRDLSLGDLNAWAAEEGDVLTLQIHKRSGFSLFSEGPAIGKLYELCRAGIEIHVECLFEVPDLRQRRPSSVKLGLFNQPFGFALLLEASRVRDRRGDDIRERLLAELWREFQEARGFIGDGRRSFVLARDPDVPIPPCLRHGDRRAFPYPRAFKQLLVQAGQAMGAESFGQIDTDLRLVTFMYEALRNSFDHARGGLDDRALSGLRGMVIEKIRSLSVDELSRRQNVPAAVGEYVAHVWPSDAQQCTFMALTVFDVGPGIHHTLPARREEAAWRRLQRAFQHGESRKPSGIDITRGEGLPNLMEACHASNEAQAFLFVRTAELTGYRDFSLGPDSAAAELQQWQAASPGPVGTSLSLLWPILPSTARQQPLFDD